MKKLFLLLVSAALYNGSYAQSQVDFFGVHAFSPTSVKGWGGGFSMLSRPLSLVPCDHFPVKVSLGGTFYMAGAGQRTIDVVSPGATTSVSFSNMHTGFSALARFGSSAEKRRSLYFDLFAGTRITSATMYAHDAGHEACPSTMLSRSAGFSGGAGAGMFIRLAPNLYLDLGLQYSASTGGKFVDMRTVNDSGDGLSYTMKSVPAGMLLLKAGLNIRMGCCNYAGCTIARHHTKACGHVAK